MKKLHLLFITLLTVAVMFQARAQEQQATTGTGLQEKPNFFKIRQQLLDNWGDKTPPPGNGYKVFKRWEHYWDARIMPDGSFPAPDHNQREWDKYLQKHPEADAASSATASWTSLGPASSQGGYIGVGRVNCIAFHPTNANIIWVGTPTGGLWKSTNGGVNWTTNTDNLVPALSLGVSSIAINPSNPNTMYIATGDKGTSSYNYFPYSVGILKSTDGGVTWNSTGSLPGITEYYTINEVIVHPTNNNIILVATSEFSASDSPFPSGGGLYRSEDSGASWTIVNSNGPFYDIKFKPGSSSFVYAASYNRLFRSTNEGVNWAPVGNAIQNSARIQIAVSPNDPKFIALVSSHFNGSFNGFYTSDNSGGDYSVKYFGQKNLLNNHYGGVISNNNNGQGTYDLCIAVSPANINTIFIGGVNLWKSTDRGLNWTLANYWVNDPTNAPGVQTVHADKHCLVWKNNTTLFQGNDGGIYRSTNSGTSWTDLSNTLVISQIYRIGVSQSSSKIICGLQDNGTKLRNTAGSWQDVNGGDGMECFIDPGSSNIMYGEFNNGRLVRTLNGGLNWYDWEAIDIPINPPPPAPSIGAWITPWAMDPNNSSTLYAGYRQVWKSTNQGDDWEYISNNLSNNNLTSLAVAPSNSNIIYVSDGQQMWRTTNGGATLQWSLLASLPTSYPNISYIAVDPVNPSKVYVTLNRYDEDNKVFKSINGGTSWTNISNSLPNLPANCITVQPGGNDALYVGTDLGVFYRDATMSEWVAINNGLPKVIVAELECKLTSGKITAATHGRGLWESNFNNTNTGNSLTITPAAQSTGSSAGSTTLSIASNISWTVSDNASWLTLSPTSGTGNATINATFTANTSTSPRVATITATGGGFSPTATITQSGVGGSTCNTPSNLQTANITPTSATFSWSAVSGATSYSVQYRTSPNGAWTNTVPATFTSTTVTVSSFVANTSYQWQVKTNCANNASSNWSASVSFTTQASASCNTPVNLLTYNITQSSASFSWSAVSGAVSYSLQYRTAPNGAWINTNPSVFTGTAVNTTGFTSGTPYEWRVRTNCANTLSDWSNPIAFTTLPAPVCNTPGDLESNNITQNSVLVSWTAVSGASNYELQTRLSPNGQWYATNPATFTNTAITINGLSANTAFQWRVRTNCTNGLSSSWSAGVPFTTLPALVCNAPASLLTSNITQNTALLSWTPVSGAESYRVQFYEFGSWLDLYGPPITSTSITRFGLFANTYNQWRVITNCTNGLQSAPSGIAGFFTPTVPVCYGGNLWPPYNLDPIPSWQYENLIYGGDFSVVNVDYGTTYTFSYCSTNGGYVGFDGEIYLRISANGPIIAYNNNNNCGTAPKLVWQAGFTGQVEVLLAKYNCLTQSTNSTMAYRIGSSFTDDEMEERNEAAGEFRGIIPGSTPPIAQNQAINTDGRSTSIEMTVYPNPASDVFNIQFENSQGVEESINIDVYNALGNLVWQKSGTASIGSNTWEVQTSTWPTGIYVIRLLNAQGQQCTQKIYVTR
jgi:hypothetical protein